MMVKCSYCRTSGVDSVACPRIMTEPVCHECFDRYTTLATESGEKSDIKCHLTGRLEA
jgi:hypothetical protein